MITLNFLIPTSTQRGKGMICEKFDVQKRVICLQNMLSTSTVRRLARLAVFTLSERFQTKSQIVLISEQITDPQAGTAVYYIPHLHANFQFSIIPVDKSIGHSL